MTVRSHDTPHPRRALFAGSFNPFTVGHASVVERALALFDTIVIAIGVNAAKTDTTAHAEERAAAISHIYTEAAGRIEVVVYNSELTVDLARRLDCRWLLRGVRSVKDFEYERDMADLNRRIASIETIVMFTLPDHAAVSSSAVRELESYGHDISSFLPTNYTTKK